jgi:hypothetical protein
MFVDQFHTYFSFDDREKRKLTSVYTIAVLDWEFAREIGVVQVFELQLFPR